MEKSLALQRHLLGSIDLEDIVGEVIIGKSKEETESERKDYCAAICAVWPRLEKDLKELMVAQLMYSSNQAEDWEKVIFGRGGFNGLSLVFEKWKAANAEHLERGKAKEEFDKHEVIGQI